MTAPKSDKSEASVASPAVSTAARIAKSAKTVVVASKIPQSVYLQRSQKRTRQVPGRYGPEPEETFVHFGPRVVIRGCNVPVALSPRDARKIGYVFPKKVEHEAALTYGVDAEWFAAWMQEHKDDEWVTGGLLYADPVENNVLAWAEEREEVKSGLEPIDMDGLDLPLDSSKRDPRLPRPMNSGVTLSEDSKAA